jgi:hypothetical protein
MPASANAWSTEQTSKRAVFKAFIPDVIALWVGSVSEFDPAHVERLRNSGCCENCGLSWFGFPEKAPSPVLSSVVPTSGAISAVNASNPPQAPS